MFWVFRFDRLLKIDLVHVNDVEIAIIRRFSIKCSIQNSVRQRRTRKKRHFGIF